jgi:hypothetical protein
VQVLVSVTVCWLTLLKEQRSSAAGYATASHSNPSFRNNVSDRGAIGNWNVVTSHTTNIYCITNTPAFEGGLAGPPESVLILFRRAVSRLQNDSPEFLSIWNRLDIVRSFALSNAGDHSPLEPTWTTGLERLPQPAFLSYSSDQYPQSPIERVEFDVFVPDLLRKNAGSIRASWDKVTQVLLRITLHRGTGGEPNGELLLVELTELVKEAEVWIDLLRERYSVDWCASSASSLVDSFS